jgi:starch-binding outer membrane protein, SusD/RagB family
MKNYKIISRAVALSLILLLSACAKLDEVPKSTLSPENFYTSSAQVESAYAASMNKLWGYWQAYGVRLNGMQMDDQYYGGDLIIPNDYADNQWGAHYGAILNINTALKAVLSGKVQNTSPEKIDQLIGEAKFLRAFNYFFLVRLFGPVPLYLENDNASTNPEARAPIADVYAAIVNDLEDAAIKLPAVRDMSKPGRVTSSTAYGLLAKVYLTMATAPLNETNNYAKAAEAAQKVMDAHVYSLFPNCSDVFQIANKYGQEIMFSFNSSADDIATDAQQWSPTDHPTQGWSDVAAEPIWEQAFPAGPRKEAYILTDIDGVHYTDWSNWLKAPGIQKYLNDKLEDVLAYKAIYNIPLLRYADVLLIFAEADNMANGSPTQAAVDAINQVIDRANGNATGTPDERATLGMTKLAFDTKVIQERNWELCFEFDRWFDLCRKRILLQETQLTHPAFAVNFSEDDYLFPIPEQDLRLNPLLKPNNPGYPTP